MPTVGWDRFLTIVNLAPLMYSNLDDSPGFDLKERLVLELQRKNIHPTPQLITALLEAMRVSPAEIVGDTDTLLAGLLR